MKKTIFSVPKMDCPSEESLIRMKMDGFPSVGKLEFNLADRKVIIYHNDDIDPITKELKSLNLGAELISTESDIAPPIDSDAIQKKALYLVLGINFIFFLIEMTSGLISRSMGLVADSLDMLADALVYGLSIYAVGKAANQKKSIARISGFLQLALALFGFGEVLRRFFGMVELPEYKIMVIVSGLAMIANISCLFILLKNKSREAHMRASMIFTSNDVVINTGVILAGVLVLLLKSNKPDLIAGAVVFFIVITGAFRILKLAK